MNFWDQKFAGPHHKYGTEPNEFLREHAARFSAASHVLVPGDGQGRNGVWLAQQGHQVLSVDNSEVGLQKARELADQRQVNLATDLVDLAQWSPQPAAWDAVVMIYTHLPASFRARAHQQLALGLRPGGWWLMEAFHPLQLKLTSGGPSDVTMLLTPDMVSADLSGLVAPVLAWHGEVDLNEGEGHQGRAHVTRWIGQRL